MPRIGREHTDEFCSTAFIYAAPPAWRITTINDPSWYHAAPRKRFSRRPNSHADGRFLVQLHFLGANRQVTGSRYVLEAGGLRILIDCGMFQERKFLERNWATPPFDPATIDVALLTHAHLDHTGLVPRLVHNGYNRRILCTHPTARLAEIIMLDAAKIQEEDAAYKRRRHQKQNRRGPYPVQPLYTGEDAKKAIPLLQGVNYDEPVKLNDQVTVTFREAGHILGSAILELHAAENGRTRRLVFSGDIGQWDKPLIGDPSLIDGGDFVVMESTYGDRNHRDSGDPADQLADLVNQTAGRGGNVVIPTFAVERAQELMFHLGRLVHADRIPDLPIYLDSPMAVDVTEVFREFRDYLDDHAQQLLLDGQAPLRFPGLRLVRSVEQSKAINRRTGSKIIMSASGMCTAGRIKHHLRNNITQPESTIVFVGYQAFGTLGRLILEGRDMVRIHGREHSVNAQIAQIHGFSAHADRDDLIRWLEHFKAPPTQLFLTHGEEDAAVALSKTIEHQLGWHVTVPQYRDSVELN